MATTTPNFGWSVPTSTDLVKDGATAIETLGDSIDASFVDLKGGTTGQVLAKASGTDLDFSWVAQDDSNAIQNAIVDAKGDLIAATAADTPARLAVGTNGQILTADSTAATGLKWATISTSPTFVGVLAYRSSNYSLSNGTGTIVPFDAETIDSNGFHDNVTNSSRLTVPSGKAGKYWVVAGSQYAQNSTGIRSTALRVNGSTYVQSTGAVPLSSSGTSVYAQTLLDLSVGDYVEMDAYQNSGGSLNLNSADKNTYLAMFYLGA
jgi:hypothetical protein